MERIRLHKIISGKNTSREENSRNLYQLEKRPSLLKAAPIYA